MRRAIPLLVVVCTLCISISRASAQAFAEAGRSVSKYTVAETVPAKGCESLSTFKAPDLVSISARVVAATADTPQHCRVTGVISPEVAFEVSLPTQWNRRFYMVGNGGLAGDAMDTPANADRTAALKNGFVIARTNTGHDNRKEPGGSFILSNPQKAVDYAYRAVHVTADTAKKIATDYYARPITFSYWNSCSNGGRQGLLEVQRFPEDFDGVVANAPWVDQTGFTLGAIWNQKALTEAPVPAAKMALVAERAMAKCDKVDGLEDGLIDDPRACSFDPTRDVPACRQGADGPDCLTPAQAGALKKIYDGPTSKGKQLFPGFMVGSEAMVAGANGTNSNWAGAIIPAQASAKPADFNLAEGVMRYLILNPPKADYDTLTLDFDKTKPLVERWSKLADAKQADLSKFRKRGGKLIMTYGWADQILQPLMGIEYYEAVVKKNKDAADFARLFMVPGMAHCSGGYGPDRHDPVTAIIDWVEKGQAPDKMIASKVTADKTVRTRPLCPYPQVARYAGSGSIDDAANFRCEAPRK